MHGSNKTYYWLKLARNFFDRPQVRHLDSDEVIIYEKMLTSAMNDENHRITYHGIDASLADEIVFDNRLSERNITTEQVNTMIDKGLRLGLIESDDLTAYIDLPDLETMVGSETKAAADKRRQRANKKATAKGQQTDNVHREEKELDKETDRRRKEAEQKAAYGRFKNVWLTPDEYTALSQDYPGNYQGMIEHMSLYKEGHAAHYNNDNAVMRDWAEKDRKKQTQVLYGDMDDDERQDTQAREAMLDDAWNDAVADIWAMVDEKNARQSENASH